ncbi:MAG: hypothetical protein AM326_01500 [Candidatus Thorarchaeota archaeon SMTZ-45]|nr:MAG: hypothetical protein AM326_01500 [Candidatus Thorarchaeota archaeon SMTZ-45]
MRLRCYPSTFSIVARDPSNGDIGIIVQSKFPAVGAVVPWALAEVGGVATQAWANTSYGPRGLELLGEGKSASVTLKALLKDDEKVEHRQVGIVDSKGFAVSHTGKECMEWAGHIVGNGYACQGNILAGDAVVKDMAEAYEKTEGDLIDRLFAALNAGQAAGGDRRGMQSAAILVVRKEGGYEGGNDRYVDVRVDDNPRPIEELERIFALYDMTLLNREDPTKLHRIEGDISRIIQQALVSQGLLDAVDEEFSAAAASALREWVNTNNFENKWREDGKIWQSVLEYLLDESGISRG